MGLTEGHWFENEDVPANYERALEDAVYNSAMLKKREAAQIPVIQREVMNMLVWCCGSCGVPITNGDKFCRMCGRRVKWE